MIKSLKLQNVGPAPKLQIEFAERLNLLTGDNGLGKSFLLDVVWWTLTGTWSTQQALPYEAVTGNSQTQQPAEIQSAFAGNNGKGIDFRGVFDYLHQSWTRPQARPTVPGLVIYARVDGGFSIWDPARNYWKAVPEEKTGPRSHNSPTMITESSVPYDPAVARPRAFQFSPEAIWNGLMDQNITWCNGLVRDWILWQYEPDQGENSRFNLLKRVLEKLSPPDEKFLPGKPTRISEDARDIPTIQTSYGIVPVTHAAAGVKRVLSLAYILVWAWSEHILASERQHGEPVRQIILLADEIESHLHPKWQRTILPALLTTAELLKKSIPVQLITTTHAPLVLASIEPDFDESKDKVFLFDLERGEIKLEEVPWSKQGDIVGWLTSDIFKLAQARSYQAEAAIEAAEAYMRQDKGYPFPEDLKTQGQIHQALLQLLPGHDPFWPRWIVHVEKQKG